MKPEDVRHFEFGVKTEPFRGVTANITVFNTDIKDFQAQVVNASVGVLRGYLANAEKVRVRGVEFDGNARVGDRMCRSTARRPTPTARYVSFPDAPPPLEETGGPQVKDISGSVLPGHLEVGGVVRRRVRDRAVACSAARASSSAASTPATARRSRRAPSASRYLVVDGYALLNARVGFRVDRWLVAVALGAQPARQGLLRAAHARRRATPGSTSGSLATRARSA